MKKYTIDEMIDRCNRICEGFERISIEKGCVIENQEVYIKNYQFADWLSELKEYKEIGLTPEQIKKMDMEFKKKCNEVNELKKKIENCIGASAEQQPVPAKLVKFDKDGLKGSSTGEKKNGSRTKKNNYKDSLITRVALKAKLDSGMTQKKIADELEISRSTIHRLINSYGIDYKSNTKKKAQTPS